MKKVRLSKDTVFILIALGIYMIGLLLNWSSFFPTLGEINPWDEASYVHSGQLLSQGKLPVFAGSPMSAALYALTNSLFSKSPLWMLSSVATIRLFAFSLIWLSAFLISWQLKDQLNPLISCGILLAAPFLSKMLRFPTDPLFVGFAGLGLWQMIQFHQTDRLRHGLFAGLFIALAASARNDGLVVFVAAFFWLVGRQVIKKRPWSVLPVFALPFLCIVGGYVILYGSTTGNYSLGTAERTYDNFEAGQIAVYGGETGVNAAVDAKREARRLFGTPEQNNYSVLRAIFRNPSAYLERLKRVTLELPGQVIKAYSGKWVVLFTFWVLWGIAVLIRRRDWYLIVLLGLWTLPFLSGFVITIFRTGHLLFPSLVLITLAGLGVYDYAIHSGRLAYRITVLITVGMLLLVGVVADEWVVIYAMSLALAAVLLTILVQSLKVKWASKPVIPLLFLLLVGLTLHGPYPGIGQVSAEIPPEEQALRVMINELPKGARILAGAPGVVYAANMTYLGISSTDVPFFDTAEAFGNWINAQQIDGVYIDPTLTIDNAAYWNLLQTLADRFDITYQSENGAIQVWIMKY